VGYLSVFAPEHKLLLDSRGRCPEEFEQVLGPMSIDEGREHEQAALRVSGNVRKNLSRVLEEHGTVPYLCQHAFKP
jgi:hypothetical protein